MSFMVSRTKAFWAAIPQSPAVCAPARGETARIAARNALVPRRDISFMLRSRHGHCHCPMRYLLARRARGTPPRDRGGLRQGRRRGGGAAVACRGGDHGGVRRRTRRYRGARRSRKGAHAARRHRPGEAGPEDQGPPGPLTEKARARPAASLPVDVGLLALAVAVVLVVLLGSASLRPYDAPELDPRPILLPVYLLRSLARLAVAYALAVTLPLGTGHLAARSPFARRLILPTLDVLQSVPILGFFPAAVAVFITVTGGSALGVEAAAVFLIFTSLLWSP